MYDRLVDIEPYLILLDKKNEAEFIYKALVEVAIYADVKNSAIDKVLTSARLNRTRMSETQRNAYDFSIGAMYSDNSNPQKS